MKKILALLCTCLAFFVTGCQKESSPVQAPAAALVLKVLAGSELKDIEPLLPKVAQATGVHLHVPHAGPVEAARRLRT